MASGTTFNQLEKYTGAAEQDVHYRVSEEDAITRLPFEVMCGTLVLH